VTNRRDVQADPHGSSRWQGQGLQEHIGEIQAEQEAKNADLRTRRLLM
jgi:hypothetical protein